MLLLMKGFSHEHGGDDYEGFLKSIQPFWISQEPVVWPWCNLAASQRRPYCSSVNSHSSMGQVSWQWDAVDSLCILWPLHSEGPSEQISFIMAMCLPILQLLCRLFLAKHCITQVCQPPYSPYLAPCNFWLFPKLKSPLKWRFVNAAVTVHKLSQRCLTAYWLAPRESDCSWMHIKVSCDWLPSYMKATWPILEIFKIAGYFLDGPRMCLWNVCGTGEWYNRFFSMICVQQREHMTRLVAVVSTWIGEWNNVCMVVLASVFSLDASNVMKSYTEVVWLWTHPRQVF